LLKLIGNDRAEFLAVLERIAGLAVQEREARFIRSIPFSIGMSEDE